jgi:NDP-sugar pyrophosphorylase family protein
MKAIVLAGGFGTRLRGLIGDTPKPMVRIGGVPLLERTLKWLAEFSFTDVYIHIFYQAKTIVRYFEMNRPEGVNILFREAPLLGTATIVRRIAQEFEGPALVVYGDLLTNVNLVPLVDLHHRKGAAVTMGIYRPPNIRECGLVDLDDRGRIVRFVEKPQQVPKTRGFANSGIYMLDRNFIVGLSMTNSADFGRDIFPSAIGAGWEMYGFLFSDAAVLIDVGTPANYERAQSVAVLERLNATAVSEL